MSTNEPTREAEARKPGARATVATGQQAKAETIRRLGLWKKGAVVASVAGFIAISGVIVDQHAGTTSTAAAGTVAQAAAAGLQPVPAGTAQATTATGSAAGTLAQLAPETTSNPARPGKATKAATAIPAASATAATATAQATSTAQATATPAATATSTTQQGGYSLGNSDSTQPPVAATSVS